MSKYETPELTNFGTLRGMGIKEYLSGLPKKPIEKSEGYQKPILVEHGNIKNVTGAGPPDPCSTMNPPPWCNIVD